MIKETTTESKDKQILPAIRNAESDKELQIDQIYCGDCVELMKRIAPNSIDLVVTSPPYDTLRNYNGFSFTFEKIANELFRVLKEQGVIVWVVGDKIDNGNKSLTGFRQAIYFQDHGFKIHDVMIYEKKNTPFMRSNAYTNCYELMIILSKKSPKTFNPIMVFFASRNSPLLQNIFPSTGGEN